MLELIAIALLSDKISSRARMKGYPRTGRFVLLFIFLWFFFEVLGIVLGSLFFGGTRARFSLAYPLAGLGAFISFKIVDMMETRRFRTEYDPSAAVATPCSVRLWKEHLIPIAAISVVSALMAVFLHWSLLAITLLIFLFTKYGMYDITFNTGSIVIRYFYGRKRTIGAEQIVKLLLNAKLFIELHWKKSRKHSTKTMKFSSGSFLEKDIPIDNIKRFLLTAQSRGETQSAEGERS